MRVDHNLAPGHAVASGNSDVPLIVHVIYRLDVGGLENGVVNLINHIPANRYRHAIICLTDYSDFRNRLQRSDVMVYALNKPAGNSPATHFRLWRLLWRLRPAIIHTRNLAALESMVAAAFARVRVRIHGEHGRDVGDLDGNNRKYQRWRRVLKVFVDHYIAVSRDLETYLQQKIAVDPSRVTQIYNGVDSRKFHPAERLRAQLPVAGFADSGKFVIGTVGRMQAVKDQLTLVRAFILLMRQIPQAKDSLRLVLIGDGPLREQARVLLKDAGLEPYVWLPGERNDIAEIMQGFDLFVLPSLAEGISNTILEAMATGLPVVATAVGGNTELVQVGVTGALVPAADPERMAETIRTYVEDADLCRRQGIAGRHVVETSFSMDAMSNAYLTVYDRLVSKTKRPFWDGMKAATK